MLLNWIELMVEGLWGFLDNLVLFIVNVGKLVGRILYIVDLYLI